jgi:DNA-binding transcriptional ArsR family regulator
MIGNHLYEGIDTTDADPMTHVSPNQDPFRAIADPNRRKMLDLMLSEERTVGFLADHLGITQPSASQHMQVLRLAGLVDARSEGRRTLYSVRAAELRSVADWIAKYEAFWTGRLDALEDHLSRMKT